MPRGKAARYDDQRELILQRAAQLFARRGYPSTSMNEVAQACDLSKATLYHYYRDKYSLLVSIADGHVSRLVALVEEAEAPEANTPALHGEALLRERIHRIVAEYAGAQDAHRVLTEDVRFLAPADREAILDKERKVVAGFARAVAEVRARAVAEVRGDALAEVPAGPAADPLAKPLTMLLFGMINWMFTWMKEGGALDHAAMAPIVADLFLGGVSAVGRDD